jgi:hypothetical protein
VARDLGLLLVVSLAAGFVISLLQGVALSGINGFLYGLIMGLVPFLFSVLLTGMVVGLHRLVRHKPPSFAPLILLVFWLLGNLLLLLDQHQARGLG